MKTKYLFLLWAALPMAGWAESLATVTAQPHDVALTFPAEALVEAVQQATVAAQVPGRIIEVRADAGQTVKKGELLMRIDAREAAEAVRGAEARYIDAKAAYDRSRSLMQQKFVSQAAVDKARAELDAAAANRSAAAAGQSHAAIVAPITGVVARRHAELGEMAAPGRALFTLYEPGGLRVTASVPQYRLSEMRAIRGAKVEFPELGKWVDAAGVTVLPTVDVATHVSQVRVNLPARPDIAGLVTPGMFARVHFVVGTASKLTVPAKAVVRRGEVAAVYVQGAGDRLALRQVRLGEAVGEGEVEVLAGLAAGEKVVLEPTRAGIALKSAGK
ncbi:MAG: efflux transporter periplasmic adaptor subunit [Rhodocyclaceae bacterium]|nr:efflux transporter periplasmic adaptor subunit [Rhodocyclaceae bacterium]